MKRTLYVCKCGSLEHSFVVTSEDAELYLEVHLSPLPFWKRVKNALKYVFGHRSNYGDFEEIVLDRWGVFDLSESLMEWVTGESAGFTPNDVY